MGIMQRLYLRIGDRVEHIRYAQWGVGTVVEARSSTLPDGICMVRVLFEDEEERSFINDLDNQMCCRNFGIVFEGEADRSIGRRGRKTASQKLMGL